MLSIDPALFDTKEDMLKELIKNFQDLENKYLQNPEHRDELLSDYKLLHFRLNDYPIESIPNYYLYTQYKKVLGFLQAAVLSRLLILNNLSNPGLIINLSYYLPRTKTDLNHIISENKNYYRLDFVNDFKSIYEEFVNWNMHIIYEVIDKLVMPGVSSVSAVLNKNIDSLMKGKLIKTEELEATITFKIMFGGLRISSLILAFLNTAGDIVKSGLEIENYIANGYPEGRDKVEQLKYSLLQKIIQLRKDYNNVQEIVISEIELSNKYKDNTAKLKTIKDTFRKVESNHGELKDFEKQIYDSFISMKNLVIKYVERVRNKLDTESKMHFLVDKWKIGRNLKNINHKIQLFIKKCSLNDDLVKKTEQFSEIMFIITDLYDHVGNFEYNQRFYSYVSEAFSSKTNVTEPGLSTLVKDLENTVEKNIIIHRFEDLKKSFSKYVFPYANRYLKDTLVPVHLDQGKNYKRLHGWITNQVESLSLEMTDYKEKQGIPVIGHGYIGSKFDGTILRWDNEKNKEIISKLLSGEEILLYADAAAAGYKTFKCNVLEFKFTSKNETIQKEIANLLDSFGIDATHLGDASHGFKNKVYSIPTNVLSFYYSFKMSGKHNPSIKNNVYLKLKNGLFAPSPYGLWSLKLSDIGTTVNKPNFDDLIKYKDHVNLELEGLGKYLVESKLKDEILDEESYYKERSVYGQNSHQKRSVQVISDTNSLGKSTSSLINFIRNWFGDNVIKIKSLSAAEEIKQPVFEKSLSYPDSVLFAFDQSLDSTRIENVLDIHSNKEKLQQFSNMFINDRTQEGQEVNLALMNLLNNQNLALLNFAVHKFNKRKNNQKYVSDDLLRRGRRIEYGQKLAFAGQIPKTAE